MVYSNNQLPAKPVNFNGNKNGLFKLLEQQLKEDKQIILLAAIQTAKDLGNPKAIPHLQRIIRKYPMQRTAANAANALEHIKRLLIEQDAPGACLP